MSRVTEIRYVGYGVADLAAERQFYAGKWCLTEIAEVDGLVYFAAAGSDERYVVRLREDPANRIDVIAFAADTRDDVNALFAKVEAAGCRTIFAPRALDGLGGAEEGGRAEEPARQLRARLRAGDRRGRWRGRAAARRLNRCHDLELK